MSDIYATVEEYRIETEDTTTTEGRIKALLMQQSVKLKAVCSLGSQETLTQDQRTLAHALVVDAVRKALTTASADGFMTDLQGATQASMSANGFAASYSLYNPSGSAYFDKSLLNALKRLTGSAQRIGAILPDYGG